MVLRHNFDSVVSTVCQQIRRPVRQSILATQLILNLREGAGHIGKLKREEGSAAGSIGNPLQHLVAVPRTAAYVCADRIDNHLGTLRHINGFFTSDMALVVLAVRQYNDGAPGRSIVLSFE